MNGTVPRMGKHWHWVACCLVGMVLLTGCSWRSTDMPTQNYTPSAVSSAETPMPSINAQTAAKAGKVLLVTGEYPPYTSSEMKAQGFFSDMVRTILNEAGIRYTIAFYPWARCKEMVRAGEAWASFPYGESVEHRTAFFLSAPIYSSSFLYFYNAKSPRIQADVKQYTTLTDFHDYVFGGASGYWYGKPADFLQSGIRTEWANDVEGLVRMLYNRRIDFFMEDELVGWQTISKLYPGKTDVFKTLDLVAATREYGLLVSREYPGTEVLLRQFNEALTKLKQDGKLDLKSFFNP